MKLDNIIYDVDSLREAIAQQWGAESEVFASIYPSDAATSLVNGMAAWGAMMQYCIVSTLANCYTSTAFSESAIYQLADTLGNDLHGNVSSQMTVMLTKKNFTNITTVIPAYSSFEVNGKKFFNPYAVIIPGTTDTVSEITLVQGEIIEVNKTTSGIENEKFYFSSEFKASYNYVTVTVNGEKWSVVDSFLPYEKSYVIDAEDMDAVILKTDPDGRSYVKVGDGNLATLPLNNSIIQIKYCSNDGIDGNIAEKGLYGDLVSPLVFTDNDGNQGNLEVEVFTTSTAYGGFSKQSLETLQYTSPYVFASGHRAIRRQDYISLLNNKCGYLTSNVWGEYEESNKIGAYDSLMMNMVYYTGLKSFESYPYFEIDTIADPNYFDGALYSNRGFYGSYSFKIENVKGSSDYVLCQDTGAKGLLFINNDMQDPRDSLLPDWIAAEKHYYRITVDGISATGSNYAAGDELFLNGTNDEILIRVKSIDTSGAVTAIELVTRTCEHLWTGTAGTSLEFATTYYQGVSKIGTGLKIKITQKRAEDANQFIYTNDADYSSATQIYSIENARSDNDVEAEYYQSLHTPTLLSPTQIILSYSPKAQGIAGIKLRACDPVRGPFPGTVAMFATNVDPMPSRENLRNSSEWDCIMHRTYLNNPYGNSNENWTDWLATNSFTGTMDANSNPIFNRYKYFVIEFYSLNDTDASGLEYVTLANLKVLYEEDASEIYYTSSGNLDIKFPTAGSPGPQSATGYLTSGLLGTTTFPMYNYTATINGVTAANGYSTGNILAYIFQNERSKITFLVKVVNIDNGVYSVSINGDTTLVGNEFIALSTPASLDEVLTYTSKLDPETGMVVAGMGGSGYKPNDVVTVNGSDDELKVRIATVDSNGSATAIVLMSDFTIGKKFTGTYDTTLFNSPAGSSGSGLKVTLVSTVNSGDGITPGVNGTINITSANNLKVKASFTGNRIDSSDVNYYDEPIIKEFNHFTTYLEFKQPEIKQVSITAKVALETNAVTTSSIIIQNVKNNLMKLFDITPDYIGKSIRLSDIYKAIMSTENVSWCKVTSPIDNITAAVNDVLIPSNIVVEEVIERYE